MATNSFSVLSGQAPRNADAMTPPIDTEALFSRCMGNASFALALLGELEASGQQHVDAIILHAAAGESQAAADAAHSLKGAAAIIGAESLSAIATAIETAGRAERTSDLLELANDLRCEMNRCLESLPAIRARANTR